MLLLCAIFLLHTDQIYACFGKDPDRPGKFGLSFRGKKKTIKQTDDSAEVEKELLLKKESSASSSSSQKKIAKKTTQPHDFDEKTGEQIAQPNIGLLTTLVDGQLKSLISRRERFVPVIDAPTCTTRPDCADKERLERNKKFINVFSHISPTLTKFKDSPNENFNCTLVIDRGVDIDEKIGYDTAFLDCGRCGYSELFAALPLKKHNLPCLGVGNHWKKIESIADVQKCKEYTNLYKNKHRSGPGIIMACLAAQCTARYLWVPAVYDREKYKESEQIVMDASILLRQRQQTHSSSLSYQGTAPAKVTATQPTTKDVGELKEDGCDSEDEDTKGPETHYVVTPICLGQLKEKQQEPRFYPVTNAPECTLESNCNFAPDKNWQKQNKKFIDFISHLSPALAALQSTPANNLMCGLSVNRTKGHALIRYMYPYDTCYVDCGSCGYHERFDIWPLIEHHRFCQQETGKTLERVPDIAKLYSAATRPEHIRTGKGIITMCRFYFCKQEKLGKELWMPAVYDKEKHKKEQLELTQESIRQREQLKRANPAFAAGCQAFTDHVNSHNQPQKN